MRERRGRRGGNRLGSKDSRSTRNRRIVAGLGVLFVAAPLIAVATVFSWRTQLPDPFAVHFATDGAADGFYPLSKFLAFTAGAVLIFELPIFVVAFNASKRADTARLLSATGVYLGGLFTALSLQTAWIQRGLVDAADANLSWQGLLLVLGLPVVPAVLGASLFRGTPPKKATRKPSPAAPRVALVDGQVPVWLGKSTAPTWLAATVVAVAFIPFAWMAFAMQVPALLLIGVLLGAGTYGLLGTNITVDGSGLTVAARLGWPKKRIPAWQLEQAKAVDVHAFRQFGGWGYRIAVDGNVGIVMRSGPGIEVGYGGGDVLVVTVNQGAKVGAATLNTAALQTD